MIKKFEPVVQEIISLIDKWEPTLCNLSTGEIIEKRNTQERNIKQILGHMIDSASNNLHRIIHLQYQKSPLIYPNYAINGNNDRWIAIQNYQNEDWSNMIKLWKYSNYHIIHVIKNINPDKLNNLWQCDEKRLISLKDGVIDYIRHLNLHLKEIEELINIA